MKYFLWDKWVYIHRHNKNKEINKKFSSMIENAFKQISVSVRYDSESNADLGCNPQIQMQFNGLSS